MMGQWQKQTELWVEPVNLGRRIPQDHLLRKINKALDLGFVRGQVAGFYGNNGNVSVDPVIIIKLMLLLFLDDVRSERELMRIVPLRLDYLWFLGYGLEDEIPNHSVLSKARKRWGAEVFEGLFARSVEQCVEAGLVDGSKLYVDASLVAANASRNSVIEVVVRREVSKLDEKAEEQDSGSGGSVNRKLRSTTDPDSTVVRHQNGKPTPSYKNHRALDDKAGVVTAVKTTTGAMDEASELFELIERHERVTASKTKVAVADSRYGNTANLIALAQRQIRAHVADLRSKLRNPRSQGIYAPERFVYQSETDCYRCPAGEILSRHHFVAGRGYYEYRPKRGTCARCSLRQFCTRDKNGRTLKRYAAQELLDKARKQSHSSQAHSDRRRRQWFQERNFAEAAVQHGFKRARWRGLWRQSIQDYLIAAIQNLRIIARRQKDLLVALRRTLARWTHYRITPQLFLPTTHRSHLFTTQATAAIRLKYRPFEQQPVEY
jgi:transposase